MPYYDYALDMILDVEVPVDQSLTEEQQEVVESAAEMLYGLIHARFVLTTRGMQVRNAHGTQLIMSCKHESGFYIGAHMGPTVRTCELLQAHQKRPEPLCMAIYMLAFHPTRRAAFWRSM